MGLRPPHLEGLMRRLAANERMLRIIMTEELLDIIHERSIQPKTAVEIDKIYMSLNQDKGEYVFDDFRNAVNEAVAEIEQESLPEHIQWRLKTCLEYLFT